MSPDQAKAVEIFTQTAALYAAVILTGVFIIAWCLDRWMNR